MILLIGINHRSAPVTIREKLSFAEARLPEALSRLMASQGVEEGLILSTCNRVEVMVRSAENAGVEEAVKRFLAEEGRVRLEELDGSLYKYEGRDAARHLFHVACGLDSMILGEPQVLGQVKRSYTLARESGSTGPILDHLIQQGLATAKRVRTDTGISRHGVSIAFAAVELARKIFGELDGRSALVLGAGKMTELATRHLTASGTRILVSGRTYERAAAFGEKFGGVPVKWEEAWAHLGRVDMVVAGTGSPDIVLRRAQVQEAVRARRSRPLFIIDIAVPRDVEASVNQIDNVYLYDIDDLQDVVASNLEERRKAADQARHLIESQVEAFDRWHRSLQITPTLVALREGLQAIGMKELERFRRRIGSMTPSQADTVQELTRSIIQKILHPPTRHLKGIADRGDAEAYAALYREIFGIPADEGDAPSSEEDSDQGVLRGREEG